MIGWRVSSCHAWRHWVIEFQASCVSMVKAKRAAASASKVPASGEARVASIMRAVQFLGEYFLQRGAVISVAGEVEADAGDPWRLISGRFANNVDDFDGRFCGREMARDVVERVLQLLPLAGCDVAGDVGDRADLAA